MNIKLFEIRDKATFILAIGIDMNPDPDILGEAITPDHVHRMLRRCGYPANGTPVILLTRLDGGGFASSDPYYWRGRTFPTAHRWIVANWDVLESGSLIDVEYLLGETTTRKESEL